MAVIKWLVGGVAGGAIGGVIWILISYYLNFEVGYIAVGIGILTGWGVRMSSRYDGTPPTLTQSLVACAIAAVMVLASKFMVVSLSIDRQLAKARAEAAEVGQVEEEGRAAEIARLQQWKDSLKPVEIDPSELPLRLARNEAQRRQQAGEELAWPPGQSLESAETESDMPPEVMQWALDKVAAMSPDEVRSTIEQEEELLNRFVEALRNTADEKQRELEAPTPDANQPAVATFDRFEIFMDSLGLFDLLWIALAMGSAYKISGDDESNVPPPDNSQ